VPPLKEIVVTYLSKNCVPKINSYFGDGLFFFRLHLDWSQSKIIHDFLIRKVRVDVGFRALRLHRQYRGCLWHDASKVPESWHDDLCRADDPWADLGAPPAHASVSPRLSLDSHGDAPYFRDSLHIPIHCAGILPLADRGEEFPAVNGAAGHLNRDHHLCRGSPGEVVQLANDVCHLIYLTWK